MASLGLHNSDELVRFLKAAGESTNIDAKGPMEWDGSEASAGLTKDFLALANSRDGGVIVVGKKELQPGKFEMTGLSDAQAASFDTTKVATWVNNYCSPPVNLVCYRQEFESQQFIVIAVSEFHDVPVICTKPFDVQSTGKPPKTVLRKGAIYVRTANAESAPISSVEEMRQLIGLATVKRSDQLLAMFQAMTKGRPLLPEKPHEELFESEKKEVRTALEAELENRMSQGGWVFQCHPVRYQSNRWEGTEALKSVVQKSAIRIRREFPWISSEIQVREWGICNSHFDDAYALTNSGLFISMQPFRENTFDFKNPWRSVHGDPEMSIGKRRWIEYKLNLFLVIEFFMLISRFAENLDVGEELAYEVTAGPLAGRQLASVDTNVWLDPTGPCKAGTFRAKKVVPVETLRASWEDLCANTLHTFFEFFPHTSISKKTLLEWVEKFKERKL